MDQHIDIDEGKRRLAEYWLRAELMHACMQELRDSFGDDYEAMLAAGYWIDFKTYISYWLSGLFVVVEGFNKLKINNSSVRRLFKENLGYLKEIRHETYHFVPKFARSVEILAHLNWAEELHSTIGTYIREYISEGIQIEVRLSKAKSLRSGRVGRPRSHGQRKSLRRV
jgi:hypothetical protein